MLCYQHRYICKDTPCLCTPESEFDALTLVCLRYHVLPLQLSDGPRLFTSYGVCRVSPSFVCTRQKIYIDTQSNPMYLSAHKCPSIFDLKLDLCKSKYSLAAQSIFFLHSRIELSSRRRFGKGFSWPSRLGFTKRTLISKIYSVNFLSQEGRRPTRGLLQIFEDLFCWIFQQRVVGKLSDVGGHDSGQFGLR